MLTICHQPAKADDDAVKVSAFETKMSLYMEPIQGSTFSFEVGERDVQCFHEDFYEEHDFILEYQCLSGGMIDIDVPVIGPEGEDIYTVKKKKK